MIWSIYMSFGKITHKGKYNVKFPDKYIGNPNAVVYRSSWERAAFLWCDRHPDVVKWCSEEVVIPYLYEVDKRLHRYFIDLYIEMSNGDKWIIEIKPSKQIKPPRKSKNKQKYIQESMTYVKNQNKWKAAREFANKRGWKFAIWDEHFLRKSGIMKF